MPIDRCPECNEPVFSYEKVCPRCGCPRWRFAGGAPPLLEAGKCTFGRWGGEDIGWRVLDIREGCALLIAESVIDCGSYNKEMEDVTWSESSLREWLNGEFLQGAFDDNERKRICESHVKNNSNPSGGTSDKPGARDMVFCLSVDEAKRYFADSWDRQAKPTVWAVLNGVDVCNQAEFPFYGRSWWWLRSPGDSSATAACVFETGFIEESIIPVICDNIGIRPAIWIRLES